MQTILANYTTSISELKKSPSSVIKQAWNETVAILSHWSTSAYLVSVEKYEKMMDIIEDYMDWIEAEKRLAENDELIRVNFNDL